MKYGDEANSSTGRPNPPGAKNNRLVKLLNHPPELEVTMFFFEWVIPLILVVLIGTFLFYMSIRNRSGAGVRTDGITYVDKTPEDDKSIPGE